MPTSVFLNIDLSYNPNVSAATDLAVTRLWTTLITRLPLIRSWSSIAPDLITAIFAGQYKACVLLKQEYNGPTKPAKPFNIHRVQNWLYELVHLVPPTNEGNQGDFYHLQQLDFDINLRI
ncbi:hypothetical protein GALMADRAFT_146850 [Galerina marginata CBS 339.88]|uniref:Uncharacterized protein n=1 Tax=Galerina marginata (strain CBS 339.88) TaxID=685588 RepID=A0A067SAB5_GALM3|nr:hypothetical protein GALMADRAFT_146850 [Galerina marginata CBS 339.88]